MRAVPLPPNTLRWPKRVLTPAQAVKYIDAAGFCMLFPVKNVPLTSLYYAVTRRNPQSDFVWDRYVEMLWKWKDELPQRKSVYYAKYFRGRGTFISREQLPFFLAMRETAAEPSDHEHFYAEGRIAKTLARSGKRLRKTARLQRSNSGISVRWTRKPVMFASSER